MYKILAVMIGGSLGSLSRYLLSLVFVRGTEGTLPVATLVANLTGSFLIGFLWWISRRIDIAPELRLLIFTGFLGGFTTFSSLMLENYQLYLNGYIKIFFIYISITIFGGFLALVGGVFTATFIERFFKI